MTTALVPVTTAPLFDAGAGRSDVSLPAGVTIAEIVGLVLPGLTEADLPRVRVSLVTAHGANVIEAQYWHRIRPRPGVHVVVRLVPGGDALRSILSIVVSIAATALGGPVAGLLGITSQFGVALVTVGLTVVGNLLINALIPPPKPEDRGAPTYALAGWQNRLIPDGAVPVVLGTMRYSPPFAAMSWSEIVGDDQYIRSLFLFGEGPLELSGFRIGETSIDEYDEADIEVRTGIEADLPVSLYPNQIVEENIGAELTRPLPRDDLGEVIGGAPSIETPVVRTTGSDASGAAVILAFPGGLVRFSDAGNRTTYTVEIRVEHRLAEAVDWTLVTVLALSGSKAEAFYRQHSWEFPSRGRYQVRLTMLTDEIDSPQIQGRCTWAALQTLRPEYPLNYSRPLGLVAMRIKATHQLNGTLDSFNVLCSRVCLDWDTATSVWVERVTSNPASLYRHVLQSPANPRPVSNDGIDLAQLQDWHDFCRLQDLAYDRVLDSADTTLRDVLIEVAAAGRASPRHDGVKWGVTIDQPKDLVIDHISPRNSWDFKSRRTYVEPPHAFRVRFKDAGNDYQDAERLVLWPGHDGPVTITEALEMPGKTRADEVWREARRRMYESIYRPDMHQVMQDGPVRVATRGDLVMLSTDVLERVHLAARVRKVVGNLVEVDQVITMNAGEDYAVRFRVFEEMPSHLPPDTIGLSVVRPVLTQPGDTTLLALDGDGEMPAAGDLLLFGTATSEAWPMIVTGVEAGQDMSSLMRLVDYAPIIDTLLAADVIPVWSSRVGAEIDENLLQPSAPRFTSVTSGISGSDDPNRIDYLIVPGSGAIQSSSFAVDYRLLGETTWTSVTIPAANGGGDVTAFLAGDTVQLRAAAISPTGVQGPYTPIVTITIGAGDAAIPEALGSVTATAFLGAVQLTIATSADVSTTQVQIYRTPAGVTLDREIHAIGTPIATTPATSFAYIDGDATRANLIANGDFSAVSAWTLGASWSYSGGTALHTVGAVDTLDQSMPITSGKWYRLVFGISGRTAGTLQPLLAGGTDRLGVLRSANGGATDRIQAVTGNNLLRFQPDSAFDGAVDNVTIWEETPTSLAAGSYDYYAEPLNADGLPGYVSGPFTIEIL